MQNLTPIDIFPKPNSATGQRKSILKNTINTNQIFDNNLNEANDQNNFANIEEINIKTKKSPAPNNNNNRRSSKFSQKSDDKNKKGSQQNISKIHLQQQNSSKGKEKGQVDKDGRRIDIFDLEDKDRYPRLTRFHDSQIFQLVLTLFTVFALFGDDIRVITTDKNADSIFDAINITCISIFASQIVMSFICKKEYRYSFFFWLDIISTLTILLDIQSLTTLFFFKNNLKNTIQLTRASRASRIGTKAGRVVRLIRLIRITRIYKQAQETKGRQNKQGNQTLQDKKNKIADKYKHMQKNNDVLLPQVNSAVNGKQEKNQKKELSNRDINQMNQPVGSGNGLNNSKDNKQSDSKNNQINSQIDSQQNISKQDQSIDRNTGDSKYKESRVSKRLSDLTTKRVVIILLLLLFIMPMFSKNFYFDLPSSNDYHITALAEFTYLQQSSLEMIEASTKKTVTTLKDLKFPVIYFSQPFKFQSELDYQSDEYNTLRDAEMLASYNIYDKDLFLTNHPQYYQIQNTILKDEDLLIYESIVSQRELAILQSTLSLTRTIFVCIVLTVAAFFFSKDAQTLALGPIERMINKVNQIANDPLSAKDQELIDEEQDQYETRIIENAIVKIGALLALGFGEAGSEIIGSNIAKHGDVDPMISGKKKCGIYGFCDIRNFTDATEVLQEDVMIFVNNIGEIVHSMVDRFMGAANKNIGDAFLLVWKFQEDKYVVHDDNTIEYKDQDYACMMAEFALLSFLKINTKINREPIILEYRNDPRLNQRMANYKVKIGYGLHIGWSIEGAIGSEFKIDASYLSPNVSMSSRLEGATKGYGVPLLFSSDLFNLLTPAFHEYIRQVDYVKVKGQTKPVGFYTLDMNIDNLPPSKLQDLTIEEKMEIEKHKKQITLQFIESNFFDVDTYLKNDKDMKLILRDFNFEFVKEYKQAFDCYLDGKWELSKEKFDKLLRTHPDDGPSKATLDYMSEYDYQAPADWSGFKPYND